MYEFHRASYDPLFTDYAIYSPRVPVIRDYSGSLLEKPYSISIITCPAVHASEVPVVREHEILPAMWLRILKVLSVGIGHNHDGIVLGAWGCGTFGNDAKNIAGLFRKALDEDCSRSYQRVIFAIVDWSSDRRYIGPFEVALQSQPQHRAAPDTEQPHH